MIAQESSPDALSATTTSPSSPTALDALRAAFAASAPVR
jgi:hypothetical protein